MGKTMIRILSSKSNSLAAEDSDFGPSNLRSIPAALLCGKSFIGTWVTGTTYQAMIQTTINCGGWGGCWRTGGTDG